MTSSIIVSIQHTGNPRLCNKARKRKLYNWKAKVKLSLLANNMIVHAENPMETVNSRS